MEIDLNPFLNDLVKLYKQVLNNYVAKIFSIYPRSNLHLNEKKHGSIYNQRI
jgi:hypothetical protein